jgi:23S rRNA (uridine2552-2'-O)-methyltransferase
VLDRIVGLVPAREGDLVLSDMAPHLPGMDAIGPPRSLYLVELAFDIAGHVLKPGGATLIKGVPGRRLSGARRRHTTQVRQGKAL